MADPTYPLFPIFAILGFVLVLVPLPWHFQAWNSGTCLYMIWTAIGCLIFAINSIIWHDNAINWAPVWCDISGRIQIGLSVAIPAASLCINRRLYKIASCDAASISKSDKRKAVIIDLSIGLGLPALIMILQFIVQGHRYDIWEGYGCNIKTFNTALAYPLVFTWPLVIGLFSAVYCVLTLRHFMRRRAQFNKFLSSNNSLSVSRYFRLMALATVELLLNTPLSAYGIYLNATTTPIQPWISWSNTHFDWFTPGQFPDLLFRDEPLVVATFELARWALVFCAFLFFGFFGFAEEARKNYKRAYHAVASRLGVSFPSSTSTNASSSFGAFKIGKRISGTLPSFTSSEKRTSRAPQHALPTPTSMETSFDKTDYSSSIATSSPTGTNFKISVIPPPLPSASSCYTTPTTPSTPSDSSFGRSEPPTPPVPSRRARPLLPFQFSSPPRMYDVERQDRPRSSAF